MCGECGKLSGSCRVSAVKEEFKKKVMTSLTAAQTEARQSLYMSGSGAALASEALDLTSMMAWLG